ncbi:integumentary mucin C.1 isoform X1 [Megalobrama amblycephala]|uniref:integumentary mucin C.1 isoform X1 n=1 Tax=Megalobrama amblycephala TaxID=75352 RepID=UPI0020144EF4|nr:integumentary mucin C.1 isoform X1 [Megalobrama amblycephala]
MPLGEIGISKTLSSKTGVLFFLILQMSLLSKVTSEDTTTSATTETSPTATAETVSQSVTTQSTNPQSSSSSTSTDQMSTIPTSTSTSYTTATTHNNTHSTSFVSTTVSTMSITSMNTVSQNASSVTGNYSAISCPDFWCMADNCYAQYMNATAYPCLSGSNTCQIMKQNTSYYVSCSASCVSCGNMTQSNCSWKCCSTANCLNESLLLLTNSFSTTVAATTSTTTTTTTKPTVPSTPANNGKKCHSIKCDGTTCYKSINTIMMCPVGQDYCMLKKTTTGSAESWQAGCSDDCRKMPVCSTSVTTCHLECCNATAAASCLKLTGEVNMPSSATRGPHCPALLMASLLLFWIVRVFT